MRNIAAAFIVFLIAALTAAPGFCETRYPGKDRAERPDPLASPEARKGGEVKTFGGQYPKSLNYYLDNNTLSAEVFGSMFETLLDMNPITLDYEPGLADWWRISDDKKTFTFHLDPEAKWSDGQPVTAEDVRWTYDAIMAPQHMTGPHKISMERFHPPKIIDKRTIRFTAKKVHWKNLQAAGGFHVLCKHAYKDKDFNKLNFEFPVVSGPYGLGRIEEGLFIQINRQDDWWAADKKRNQGKYNFDTITYRFYAERTNAFEAFKKGKIDIFPVYTSRIWINETNGEAFFKNHIIKQKVYNHQPVGFQGFAMNMRKPPFDDIRVRKAMAHLLDRRKMNRTLMYNQYFLHRSYFEDLYAPGHPCPNPLIELDKQKARDLLEKAGWRVNPETGYLEKDGRRFTFRFLSRNSSSDKFLSIYAEDLKDVGIDLKIDKKDWAAWARDMDAYNFQMTWAAWSSGVFKDPESMWLSKEAERKGGNNITGFKNETVDALIEKQKTIFDIQKRNEICRQIDRIIYQAYPYVLLWNIDYTRLLYWNKFGTPKTVLSKYGDETSALVYWWMDPDAKALLNDSVEHDAPMPPKPASVRFDEVFKGESKR
ncbi:MAG: ABC transporter substrate-binding protein [Desulfobacterales bacterium]|nr:ABC transporter substrate-binding protein [Desulfobacterales bacterium]